MFNDHVESSGCGSTLLLPNRRTRDHPAKFNNEVIERKNHGKVKKLYEKNETTKNTECSKNLPHNQSCVVEVVNLHLI